MKNIKFITLFAGLSVIYLVLYLLIDDAFIYLIGGTLATVIEFFLDSGKTLLVALLWVILLVVLTVLFFRSTKAIAKYSSLIGITILMYIIDFALYNILSFDTPEIWIRYLNVGLMIVIKSLILSLLIYLHGRQKVLSRTVTESL